MNRSRRDPFRMGLAAVTSLLMLTLSVVVPVLEQGALGDRPVVENPHKPGECPSGHDHTVCTQVGANLSLEGLVVDTPRTGDVVHVRASAADLLLASSRADGANRSRAPPLA